MPVLRSGYFWFTLAYLLLAVACRASGGEGFFALAYFLYGCFFSVIGAVLFCYSFAKAGAVSRRPAVVRVVLYVLVCAFLASSLGGICYLVLPTYDGKDPWIFQGLAFFLTAMASIGSPAWSGRSEAEN